MALQYSTTLRNALLDQIETSIGASAVLKIWSGSQPATCAAANSGTQLAAITLAADWASAAASGAKSFSSLPITDNSIDNNGTAGHWRLYASDGTTCHMQGSVTETGGGGDLTVDSVTFVQAEVFSITTWTWTAPGA